MFEHVKMHLAWKPYHWQILQ